MSLLVNRDDRSSKMWSGDEEFAAQGNRVITKWRMGENVLFYNFIGSPNEFRYKFWLIKQIFSMTLLLFQNCEATRVSSLGYQMKVDVVRNEAT